VNLDALVAGDGFVVTPQVGVGDGGGYVNVLCGSAGAETKNMKNDRGGDSSFHAGILAQTTWKQGANLD
jgi:hypothetical protein